MIRAYPVALAVIIRAMTAATEPLPPLPEPLFAQPARAVVQADTLRDLIEEDWLLATQPVLTTQSDAAGACNGVKDGVYSFHVGHQANPWWQVDLGESRPVGKIIVYNRLDYAPGLHNADTLQILISVDGNDWTLCYDNEGRHFGGIHGAPPLTVTFDSPGVTARFVRLMIPSEAPIFLHLDEVEIYAPGDDSTNLALYQPADQSSLSIWSTAKVTVPRSYPIQAFVERGRRLGAYLSQQGVDVEESVKALDTIAKRVECLPSDAPESELRDLYLETRWHVRRIVFQNPLLDFDRLLFVKRFTQETFPDVCLNHMPWVSRPGGDLCVLEALDGANGLFAAIKDPATGNVPAASLKYLLNGALGPGRVHGMELWFEGDRIVFGYARRSSDEPAENWLDRSQSFRLRREEQPTHLFELNLTDGQVRRITRGEWSDLDPTYAPNGDIVFVSERCGTSLQCNEYDKDETSCNLYVVRPDGSGIRRLSVNKDGDYMPHCLDNGMIVYTRWEYQERSFAYIQSLWTIRPDGTGADALFKQHLQDPWALVNARSIPNSNKLAAIATGHHTLSVGPLVIINPARGINNPEGIAQVTPTLNPPQGGMSGVPVPQGGTEDHDGFYSTPWPLSEKFFLAAYTYGNEMTNATGYGLYLVDVYGNRELIYRDPAISCFTPIPLRPRPIPHIVPEAMDLEAEHAFVYVSDITHGVEGIAPGQARYLRIAEPVPWPYDNKYGGHRFGEDHRYGGPDAERRNLTNWTPVRILGDVPVNSDGSAFFRVPPDRAVYFQLLDENRMELRRMRSFISFQPGELRGCVGCHETREVAALHEPSPKTVRAWMQAPADPLPAPWRDRPVNFLRDVQPVLDRHCVQCHSGLTPDAGLDFAGGLIAWDDEVPHYGHNRAFETILEHALVSLSPSRMQDASVTEPLAYGAHRSKLIAALDDADHRNALSLSEEERLRLVMWADANAPYHDRFVNKRAESEVYNLAGDHELRQSILEVHARRCSECHEPESVTRLDWIDLYAPGQSLFLSAPLATEAGGLGRCGSSVYTSMQDPDYAGLASRVNEAVARAWQYPRRDMKSLNRLSARLANPGAQKR